MPHNDIINGRWVFAIEMAQTLELAIAFACYFVLVAVGDTFSKFIDAHVYMDVILIAILLVVPTLA